jgi:hypothetical protein
LHAKRRIIGREVDEIAAASAWVERSEGGRAAARTPLVPRLLNMLEGAFRFTTDVVAAEGEQPVTMDQPRALRRAAQRRLSGRDLAGGHRRGEGLRVDVPG